jgi:hypothetical protein
LKVAIEDALIRSTANDVSLGYVEELGGGLETIGVCFFYFSAKTGF